MTTPEGPEPLSTDLVTHVRSPDGWTEIQPGSLLMADPAVFIDARTGTPRNIPGLWGQFTGAADGIPYGFLLAPGDPLWVKWVLPPPAPEVNPLDEKSSP